MRIFVVMAMILGTYFWFLISTTNMVVDQTMQLNQRYQTVAQQADQIAAGNR